MSILKVFLLYIFGLMFTVMSCAGEPGTEKMHLKKKESTKIKEIPKKKPKSEILVNTNIEIPKNPIDKIFLQTLGEPLDTRYVKIVSDCLPAKQGYQCKIVKPKKNSNHFNQYYYYLNQKKEVYGVIAFRDYRIGSVEYCRDLINEWKIYFDNFEFDNKTNETNLDQLILITNSIKSSEIYMSCYPENYRDIKSYFSLKLFTNEN